MAAMISQLSCTSLVNRSVRLQRRSIPCRNLQYKPRIFMSFEEYGVQISASGANTSMTYDAESSLPVIEGTENSIIFEEEVAAANTMISEPVFNPVVVEPKRAAKIHDFCFGIPYGGFVLSCGVISFILSRNPLTLGMGALFGGALLALSTMSLKVWRQGKSSFPFIAGQAALAAALLWKNSQSYLLTKKTFPTGFYAAISAAMLCFYSYVVISGGNPPPKKLKSTTIAAS